MWVCCSVSWIKKKIFDIFLAITNVYLKFFKLNKTSEYGLNKKGNKILLLIISSLFFYTGIIIPGKFSHKCDWYFAIYIVLFTYNRANE